MTFCPLHQFIGRNRKNKTFDVREDCTRNSISNDGAIRKRIDRVMSISENFRRGKDDRKVLKISKGVRGVQFFGLFGVCFFYYELIVFDPVCTFWSLKKISKNIEISELVVCGFEGISYISNIKEIKSGLWNLRTLPSNS